MPPLTGPVLVVVSYYDARPRHELERLLTQLANVPAGWPFAVRLVVNQDSAAPLDLGGHHPGVEVLHRPNAGYNIGAWEHGWRADPAHGAYLFLQHECTLVRDGWLRAFVDRLQEPGVGLVGERINPAWDASWAEVERRFAGHSLPGHAIDGAPAERLPTYRRFFAAHGVEPGERADHLQTLVLAARRETLLAIGGFPVGRDYGEAIAAEIAISKRVQMEGLAIREVGERPFVFVAHPQWAGRDAPAPRRASSGPPRLGLAQWLQQVRGNGTFADKPWLVLGKGPTFARLTAEHRGGHHLFGLNHVVRELPLAIAHLIDVDVAFACAGVLAANCRFLLMPRVPHVRSSPGQRRLEDWFDELPVLHELDEAGRLVWYNCSTAGSQRFPGSPVVEVEYFSSEAAFDVLGRLGARTVRSLGVDGGRRYGAAFADLDGSTRLQNGQPLFDLQFARIRSIARRHGIDWAPLVPPLPVCIAGDASADLPAAVLEFTLRKHGSLPLAITRAGDHAAAPAGAICVDAASLATGDVAAAAAAATGGSACPAWLEPCGEPRPWRTPSAPTSERWLDAFAEAVNAGFVTPRILRRAVARGDADRALWRLPPAAGDGPEQRMRALQRELANLRLSLTFRAGRLLLAPALALRRLRHRRHA